MNYNIDYVYHYKKSGLEKNTYNLEFNDGDYRPFQDEVIIKPASTLSQTKGVSNYTFLNGKNHFGKMFLKNPNKHIYAGNCSFIKNDLIIYIFFNNGQDVFITVLQDQYYNVRFDDLVYNSQFLSQVRAMILQLKK